MKRLLAIIVALAMTLSLAACGGSSDSENSSETTASGDGESKVTVGMSFDPQNIGPFQGMSGGRMMILYTVYEFLVTSEGGEMEGVLMKDYEKIDELTYNCEIYDYIYDQAGNQITAADVAWCYQTAKDSGNLPKLASIASVEAIDDYVVQFKFDNLAIGDLAALWMECPIVSQKSYEESEDGMATMPVTTSAYKCTEFVSGSKMVFERNEDYWQTDDSLVQYTSKHNVDTIEFDIILDGAQLTNALKTGAIDVTNTLAETDVPEFEDAEGFAVSPIPNNTTYFLYFNCDEEQGVFADNPDLRKAIAYAIDSEQLVEGGLNGLGTAVKSFGNTNYSDYMDKWEDEDYYDYDLDKAKELLKSAGGEGMTIKMMVTSNSTFEKVATVLQAQLAQIGINVELAVYETELFNEYVFQPGEWDLCLENAGSTSYLANVWKLEWDSTGFTHGGAKNFVKDEKLQSLITEACDMEKHGDETMDAFHQYLKEQCYGIGLIQDYINIAHTDKITEIVVDPRGAVIPGACSYSF